MRQAHRMLSSFSRRALRLGLLLAFFWLLPTEADARPTVILLSWDGVRHDYPERTSLPGLERMAKEGLRADRLRPVFPSNTFPSHAALATGTHPDRHGIVDNRFYDRKRGLHDYGRGDPGTWLDAEPLWAAAERQGVPAAVFFWVGGDEPWKAGLRHEAKAPFDESVPESEKVDQILEWLDRPPEKRPGLIMSWWRGADSVGHRWGPDTPDIAEALQGQDVQLRRLFAGIDERKAWGDVTVLVVSDHGMTTVTEMVDLASGLQDSGIEAQVYGGSSVAHVFLENRQDLETASKALSALEGVRVYRGEQLPPAFRMQHTQRTGDLVVTTDAPRTFYRDGLAKAFLSLRRVFNSEAGLGMHGYDPDHPDMGAILFALGRGIPAGARPGEVNAIDVAPTVAALVGMQPPEHSEGQIIPEVQVKLSADVESAAGTPAP